MKRFWAFNALVCLIAAASACGSSKSANVPENSESNTSGPIAGLTDQAWTFTAIPGARCRDGSGAGLAINPNAASTKLMIYLGGGGACFNTATCEDNKAKFGADDFKTDDFKGVLSRTDDKNVFKDWNMVFVPYCTGDVHSGNASDVVVHDLLPGQPDTQQFVGYSNMSVFLERLVPTFPNTSHVVLVGESAGGFGAIANYAQAVRAFAGAPVDLIDDAGPTMRTPQIATCLQSKWSSLWNWSATLIAECGAGCMGDNPVLAALVHLGTTYPERRVALIDSTADAVMSTFFGFGADNCSSFSPIAADQYEAGLADIRDQMSFDSNFGSFIFQGFDHTSLVDNLDTRSSAGVRLSDWVAGITTGTISNVGP